METEIIQGILLKDADLFYTKGGKSIGKTLLRTDEEDLNILAWEEVAETLSELKKDDEIIIKGYRKYNDYNKREEFTIMQFIKREQK
jgi:hypothetical protein